MTIQHSILFVDDEPRVLAALQRMLRSKRNQWDMVFVDSGSKALLELGSKNYQLVISDMRMPRMDGAELLTEVKRRHPQIIRVVLSGHTDLDAAMRVVSVAHSYLNKPSPPQTLTSFIEKVFKLQTVLLDTQLQEVIGSLDTLPSTPNVYQALTLQLQEPNTSIKDVAKIIGHDIAITIKILQLANSAFFGAPQSICRIDAAISYLGISMIRKLVLTLEVFKEFTGSSDAEIESFEYLQRHALLVATLAKEICLVPEQKDNCFIAGLLHDIGKLVLLDNFPDQFKELTDRVAQTKRSMVEIEKELFKVTHVEIGAYLVGIWGMSLEVIEAVANHYKIENLSSQDMTVTYTIHVANILAHLLESDGLTVEALQNALHPKLLETKGCENQLDHWVQLASEIDQQQLFQK